jgi:hypothetical protein
MNAATKKKLRANLVKARAPGDHQGRTGGQGLGIEEGARAGSGRAGGSGEEDSGGG